MAACLPRFNPLMFNFFDGENVNYNEYFDEYYKEADIDVMCSGDKFEFIDKVYNFSNKIKENIIRENNINDVKALNSNVGGIDIGKDVAIYMSQGGKMTSKLTAPIMKKYLQDSGKMIEFPNTIKVDFC
jgi:hypothetical protein